MKNGYIMVAKRICFLVFFISIPWSLKASLPNNPSQKTMATSTQLHANSLPPTILHKNPQEKLLELMRSMPREYNSTCITRNEASHNEFDVMLGQLDNIQKEIEKLPKSLSDRNKTILKIRISFMGSRLLYLEEYTMKKAQQRISFLQDSLARLEQIVAPPKPTVPANSNQDSLAFQDPLAFQDSLAFLDPNAKDPW